MLIFRQRRHQVAWFFLAVFVFGPALCAMGQILELNLDGSLQGNAGSEGILGQLGPGAKFVESVEGQGVEPGESGPAVIVPVPEALWKSEGTLAFRLRPSRALRFHEEGDRRMRLLSCPIFDIELVQRKDQLRLETHLAHDGTVTDKVVLDRFALGKVAWSHLKAHKWYHLAISWDSNFPENRLEAFLNGASQEEMRPGRGWWHPWKLPTDLSGDLKIGGSFGEGETAAKIAIDSIQLYPAFMDEADLAETLEGRPNFALTNEGRWDHQGALNLDPHKLTLLYATEFDEPLDWIHEDDLFKGDQRTWSPKVKDWVLEGTGGGTVWTENGQCVVRTNGKHQVLWNTRPFPESFLLEFGMSPKHSRYGLAIVFFAARCRQGGSPFDLGLPRRGGDFREYINGAIDCYHCSYWATVGDILRRTVNLRKNAGFLMPAVGIDRIGGAGPGPHRVRILKVGNKIQVETRGKLALIFEDDGQTYGPVLNDGYIGLRQMGHSRQVSYTHFKVWRVDPREQIETPGHSSNHSGSVSQEQELQ